MKAYLARWGSPLASYSAFFLLVIVVAVVVVVRQESTKSFDLPIANNPISTFLSFFLHEDKNFERERERLIYIYIHISFLSPFLSASISARGIVI
jgi:hypothetical protein